MIAIETADRSITYEEFEELVTQKANLLKDEGPYKIFAAEPTIDTVVLIFALIKLKKIFVPLSFKWSEELRVSALLRIESACQKPSFNPIGIASFLFTSGSSGIPKIAAHSLDNYLYSAKGSNILIPLKEKDRWELSLPLHHVSGLSILFRVMQARATLLIGKNLKPTHLSLVPTQLKALKEIPEEIKVILLGGAPIESGLLERSEKIFPSYGMTEMSSQIVTKDKVHPFAEYKINADGEVLVRGKVLFKGYLQEDGTLNLPLDNGWFKTGDLAQDSPFRIIGRKDRLFITGGENVQPEEIESALLKVQGIEHAAVISIDDDHFGKRPVAFIYPFIDENYVQEQLKKQLPKFKIPDRFFPFPEKPEGKILYSKLASVLYK